MRLHKQLDEEILAHNKLMTEYRSGMNKIIDQLKAKEKDLRMYNQELQKQVSLY